MVHNKALNQFTESHDELPCPSYPDNGLYDGIVIGLFIPHIHFFRNQLLNHIGKLLGQGLSHLGPGVFAGSALAHLDKSVQGNLVPVLPVPGVFQYLGHLLPGIINQGGQGLLVLAAQGVAEHIVDLAPHGPGSVSQHMGKRLVLAVDIREEMFGPLGQVKDCLQINHLCGSGCYGWI